MSLENSPGSAAWSWPLALSLLTMMLIVLIAGLWPRAAPGPLTRPERDVTRASKWGRFQPLVLVLAWGGLCLLGVALLTTGPRVRKFVSLRSKALPPGDGTWEKRARAESGKVAWRYLDAAPLVDAVLADASAEGAASWLGDDPSRRDFLRKRCVATLLGEGRQPKKGEVDPINLPSWVVRAVELSLVQGLVARRDVTEARVLVDPADRRQWDRLHRTGGPWSAIKPEDDGTSVRPRVLRLFDARIEPGGQIHFRALIERPAGSSGRFDFQVMAADGSDLGTPTISIVRDPDPRKPIAALEFSGQTPPGGVRLLSKRDGAETPLQPATTGPTPLPVVGTAATELVRLWNAVRDDTDLGIEASREASGRLRFEPIVRSPTPAEASVHVDGPGVASDSRAVMVLAPGLVRGSLPSLSSDTFAATNPLIFPAVALRVSSLADLPATVDSWMSIALRSSPPRHVPVATSGTRSHASGVFNNQDLDHGRLNSPTSKTIGWPVVEAGSFGGKSFMIYRVDAGEQGLLWTTSGLSTAYDPIRARAFVTSLAWAAEYVMTEGRPPRQADGPEVGPLLTSGDLENLEDRGHRPVDLLALLALALAGLLAIAQAFRWNPR